MQQLVCVQYIMDRYRQISSGNHPKKRVCNECFRQILEQTAKDLKELKGWIK